MEIQVRTDSHIEGGEKLKDFVKDTVASSLSRFGEQITRVQVHLQDVNSHKKRDNDKRCAIEVRVAGIQPLGVSNSDDTVEQALAGALDKLQSRLDTSLGKLGRRD